MAVQRSLFAALKHLVPSDMEYYLEEMNSEGKILLPLGQSSFFSLAFSEEKPELLKYVVDCPTLPKALYMQKLTEEGWDFMGQSMNCYIWRKSYEKGNRPEDFSDKLGQQKHCLRQGIVFLIFALIFLALMGVLTYTLYKESHMGPMPIGKQRVAVFLVAIALQLPFIAVFSSCAFKLLKEVSKLKNRIMLQKRR